MLLLYGACLEIASINCAIDLVGSLILVSDAIVVVTQGFSLIFLLVMKVLIDGSTELASKTSDSR